jgi:hypothetical protein
MKIYKTNAPGHPESADQSQQEHTLVIIGYDFPLTIKFSSICDYSLEIPVKMIA